MDPSFTVTLIPIMAAHRIDVALLGFSNFERSAQLCVFRLGALDALEVHPVDDVEAADVIVADADFPAIVRRVRGAGRINDTIFVGSEPPDEAMAWMLRPIDPQRVLRRLVEWVRQSHPSEEGPCRRASQCVAA
jgi:hypothetical protein